MGTATCVSSVRYRLYIVIFMMDLDNYQFDGISVAIIDDHEVVLEGFRSYMVKKGLREVEAFSRAQPLLDRIHSHPFSVYVVDVEMPGTDGVQLIDSIRAIDPEARIIVNTIHEEAWVVNEMTEKGVEGVIYKSAELEVLLVAAGCVSVEPQAVIAMTTIQVISSNRVTRFTVFIFFLLVLECSSLSRKIPWRHIAKGSLPN